MTDRYPLEDLNVEYEQDDGQIVANVERLADAVVGHRIVSAEHKTVKRYDWSDAYETKAFVLTLDNGKQVSLKDTDDCCAFTELQGFFLHPESVDHVILGVGTTGEYTTWHIYADWGDILKLEVGWSPGNPFYYGYGFNIEVVDVQ